MLPESSRPGEASVPLSYVLVEKQNGFSSGARVVFQKKDLPKVQYGSYEFRGSTLKKINPDTTTSVKGVSGQSGIPVFSILAVLLIIIFRNLFYNTFQNHFLSIRNNYEIDFNIQKIGVLPVFLGFGIIILSLFDFFRLWGLAGSVSLFTALQMVFYPMLLSASAVFLFAASLRIFPILFPDIKILFWTALGILLINFTGFSQPSIVLPFLKILPLLFVLPYFLFRSILFSGVMLKFYRFHTKLTLFYICTLNLTTCLIFHKVLY